MRGMTRAFQQGQLNLMGSLIGLSERRRAEQTPCLADALDALKDRSGKRRWR